jgi:hypothetical protein
MYTEIFVDGIDGTTQRHIQQTNANNSFTCFPADPENPHYVEYLAWVAEGNEPLPADN